MPPKTNLPQRLSQGTPEKEKLVAVFTQIRMEKLPVGIFSLNPWYALSLSPLSFLEVSGHTRQSLYKHIRK